MKVATQEQLSEIKALAQRKLESLQDKISKESYDDLLLATMTEIAHDLGLLLPSSVSFSREE